MPRTRTRTISETDLYAPIANYLRAQGYTVRSEVAHCDITAVKEKELVVIELKRAFNTALLIQATRRQKLTDSVYVALPKPKWSRTWLGIKHILRCLELGLITVSFAAKEPEVEIVFHPLPFQRKKQRSKTRAVLREIANRSGDFNQGGSTRRKLMTAYRENAIQIACCLECFDCLSPKQLRAYGTGGKTYAILHRNVYGWFERVGPAQYGLRPTGRAELEQFPEISARYRTWACGLKPEQESALARVSRDKGRASSRQRRQEKTEADAK